MVRVFSMLLSLSLVLTSSSLAFARISMEPLRDELRRASPDLLTCRDHFNLRDGRYGVRFTIDELGKVEEFELTRSPGTLSRSAAACVESAFSHLRFPARRRSATREHRPTGGHVPPDHRRRRGRIHISWPFVLTSPSADPG